MIKMPKKKTNVWMWVLLILVALFLLDAAFGSIILRAIIGSPEEPWALFFVNYMTIMLIVAFAVILTLLIWNPFKKKKR